MILVSHQNDTCVLIIVWKPDSISKQPCSGQVETHFRVSVQPSAYWQYCTVGTAALQGQKLAPLHGESNAFVGFDQHDHVLLHGS